MFTGDRERRKFGRACSPQTVVCSYMLTHLLPCCSLSSTQVKSPVSKMGDVQRTFIMVKPDGVQRGLVGAIIKRFETKGYRLVALRMMQVG